MNKEAPIIALDGVYSNRNLEAIQVAQRNADMNWFRGWLRLNTEVFREDGIKHRRLSEEKFADFQQIKQIK